MVSKQVGAIFTILGGVFYVIGAFVGTVVSAFLFAFSGAFSAFGQPSHAGTSGLATNVLLSLVFGLFTGAMIITGVALINSESAERRKAGGILAITMMVIGALPTLGGLIIGFLFTILGSVIGLTYKGQSDIIIGTTSVTPSPAVSVSAPRGPVKFCEKCGSSLREGALFCGSCGAPVPT